MNLFYSVALLFLAGCLFCKKNVPHSGEASEHTLISVIMFVVF
jgi:hypothetical protein